MMRKLRLVKVVVQPVFVIDDGETLTELPVEPVLVSGAEWATYIETRWPQAVHALEQKINAPSSDNRDV